MPKYLNNIDLNKNELQNAVVHVASTKPSSPALGQIFFDSDVTQIQVCTNASGPVWEGLVSEVVDTDHIYNTALKIGRDADNHFDFTTDNTIDIYLNGAKDFTYTANTFTAQSGSTIAAQALTATTVTASGIIKTDDTTNATSTTDGSLQTDGGLSVALDAVFGDDVFLLTDSAVLGLGVGKDFTITHDGTTGATLAGNPVNITGGGASTWKTTAGAIVIDAEASTVGIDGHTGVTIASSNSGEVDITSAANIDINATTGIAADGTTVSIDGTDDSNLTVTGSGKDLDLAVAGGGTQELRMQSAGTGAQSIYVNATAGGITINSDKSHADAIYINSSAGGINIDAADMIDIDAADEITLTTTSVDGHISLVSAHGAGQAILLQATTADDSEIDIDAGVLDINVTNAATFDASSITMTTTDATFTSSTSAKPVVNITNTNADAASGELRFNKDSSTGADNDVMGMISFYGTDAAENTHQRLAYMDAIITDSAHGSEAASMRFYVAENDGTNTLGLTIAGQADDNGEVDVTIGAGAGSTTTITGNLQVDGTTTTVNQTTIEETVSVLVFEGATADAHETTLKVVEPTADCTFSLPTLTAGDYFIPAIAGTATDASAAVTATEFALLDGGSTVGTTAVANGDGIVTNDAGTMRHTTVQTFQTYFDANSVGGSNIVTTGALDAGSITSGFGSIDNGSSAITTTGAISGGTIDASTDFTIGTTVITDDSIVMTPSSSDTVTIAAATHGILNVTTVDAAGTAADVNLTADGQIEYRANDAAGHIFDIAGTDQLTIVDGAMSPVTDSDVDLGTSSLYWKDAFIDKITTTGAIELGAASDTTIARSAAGAVTVEGFQVALCKSWVLNNSVSGVASADNITYTITHGMGSSRNYGVEIIRNDANSGDGCTAYVDVGRPNDTTITVVFASAQTAGNYTALVTKFP